MDNNALIEKIVGYIESNEQTRELMVRSFSGYPSLQKKLNISDEDKIKAAYALNMCTVSVSQIIDYRDLNVLEQEYEAILNNLNLEQIPKDDALLHILKQLLDTITYFRIEAGEKEMIEKEYQQKMKNAIWASVPNFGMIVAGGSPITMAISLASQVGIGYMNYRRNKAEYSLDKERKEWELQKTAIEQFNGLRRELFDTAWRLADTYGFPDGYRLTERQITQYNKILMDQDEIRKYERLESIKDDFEAYPPFWYFIGNAANYIAGSDYNLSDETRSEYRKKALEYFEKFESLNKYNILRQDQLVASCALEHIDLLLLSSKPDFVKIKKLLADAVKSSKNSNDILELCALTYLKIGEQDEAARILRILVNEDYNRVINAQLLSSIYVYKMNRVDYELLATRVDSDYLYPMPQNGEDVEVLQAEFGRKQKAVLKLKYRLVLEDYLRKYSVEWNRITSVFDVSREYPDTFFLDTDKAKGERSAQARHIYADNNKRTYYQQRMAEAGYELNILGILNEMSTHLFESQAFSDYMLQQDVEEDIRERIIENKDEINDLQKAMTDGAFSISAYLVSQTITLKQIVGRALQMVIDYAVEQVDGANINDITYLESNLRTFCADNGLDAPEIAVNRGAKETEMFEKKGEPFSPQLFGAQAVAAKKNAEFVAEMTSFIKEKMNVADLLNDQTVIYYSGTPEFNGYFLSTSFERYADVRSHAIMILKDKTKRKFDLIFTTDGIVSVIKDKVKNLTPYDEVKLKGDSILLYRNEVLLTREYKALSFDINVLYNLIRQLGTRFVKNLDEKTEYIDGVVTPEILNQWFKEREDAMSSSVTRIYAIPNAKIVEHLGYHFEESLDPDRNLIQCYYETETGDILGLRVVQFEKINSNLQAYLLEHDGMIKVK